MTGAEIARRTRTDQDLSEHVEDERVLARIAQLLNVKRAADDTRCPSRTVRESSHAEA
jgi:hypothetical protein